MKGKILEKPFEGYKGYTVWHKRIERWYICLVPIMGSSLMRRTITLAKYNLSLKLGRFLQSHEQVDHKDGNKINDSVDNLQVLTTLENARKSIIERGKSSKPVERICPVCGITFYREPRQINFKVSAGKRPTCSKKCGRKIARISMGL